MSMKTNKSFSKRLKITKNGKIKARKAGINHFNAKASRSKQINAKVNLNFVLKPKQLGRFLPGIKK
ncbi:MAG: 50S ribosomal protein L35 [Candidatus Pacebacteria bacterium]|nr:50S ribosomal protein L35 [Candidatus Paceibacterota bacterium]